MYLIHFQYFLKNLSHTGDKNHDIENQEILGQKTNREYKRQLQVAANEPSLKDHRRRMIPANEFLKRQHLEFKHLLNKISKSRSI